MDKHTKTPWRQSYVSDGRLTSVVGPDGAYVADRVKIPDASLIVTAVNERPALLKVEEALRAIYNHKTPLPDDVIDIARSALSLLDEARNGK